MDTSLPGRLHKIAVDAAHLEVAVLHTRSPLDRPQISFLLRNLLDQVVDALLCTRGQP